MLDSKFWEKYFRVYDFLNLCIPYQEMQKKIIEELEIQPGELVLDAGAGTCNLLLEIKNKGANVIALDSSKEALEICLKKDKSIKTVLLDLKEKLPFPANYFDKIISVNTLFLIEPQVRAKILKEFYRVLKNNGKIILINLKEGFRPIKIYREHFRIIRKRQGWLATIEQILKFIIPSLKLLYYAKKIAGKYYFFKNGEQVNILQKSGFKKISKTEKIYANQAFLNTAFK